MRRVVVTGMGAITPIGLSVDEFWNSVKESKVGIAPITKFETDDFKVHLAAEVKGFVAKEYMDAKAAKRMEEFVQYAVAATKEAMEQSGLDMEKEDPYRVGIALGSGTGSLQTIERNIYRMQSKGINRMEPLAVPMMISNMAAGNVSIHFGLKGKSINVVTACASGNHNIGEAFRTIQHGEADVMIAGGAEAAVCPVGMGGFHALTALNTTEDPTRASIPFDKDRAGFVLGEGAGVVVLEELEHAKARGAKILAELVGYAATSDAYHITSPSEDGMGAANAMIFAMRDAGIEPSEVDYINANWHYAKQLLKSFNTKNRIIYLYRNGLNGVTEKVQSICLNIDCYIAKTYEMRHMFDNAEGLLDLCAGLLPIDLIHKNIDNN